MYSNELFHHGTKGMRWGIRKKSEHAGVSSRLNYFGAKATAQRINAISKDSRRMASMSNRQKKSLQAAQEYWNAKAAGKATPKRNIFKREADRYRSYSTKERAAATVVLRGAKSLYHIHQGRAAYNRGERAYKTPYRSVIGSTAMQTGQHMVNGYLFNRILGHY